MDWAGIAIVLAMVAVVMGLTRVRLLGGADLTRLDPVRQAPDRPSREASHYRASGVLPRWQ